MGDSYILVRCDPVNVAPLRRAMIAAETPTNRVSHFIVDSKHFPHRALELEEVYNSYIGEVSQIAQDWKDHKLGMMAVCATCDHQAVSLTRKAGAPIRFLQRLGWAMRTAAPADILVCNRCATPLDSPISIFDRRWAYARRQIGVVRLAS